MKLDVWQSSVTHQEEPPFSMSFMRMRWPVLPNPGAERRLKERIRFLMEHPHLAAILILPEDERLGPLDFDRSLRLSQQLEVMIAKRDGRLHVVEFPSYPPGYMFRLEGWCWKDERLWAVSPKGYLYPPPSMIDADGLLTWPDDQVTVGWDVDTHSQRMSVVVMKKTERPGEAVTVLEQFHVEWTPHARRMEKQWKR